jgi:hypothetical protein
MGLSELAALVLQSALCFQQVSSHVTACGVYPFKILGSVKAISLKMKF